MIILQTFKREASLLRRDRSLIAWILVVLLLSSVAVWFGVAEVNQQRATIALLHKADVQDRLDQSSHQTDWGGAAYYNFHLTYDLPSDFAFAALGQRDVQPWKHRIRMLALEGQIYERDAGNPVIALVGRFDFAFLAAFIVPLVLIMLLYDLKAKERVAGRHDLLEATGGDGHALWRVRASLAGLAVWAGLVIPLMVAGMLVGTTLKILLSACLLLAAYVAFWSLLCFYIASWRRSGSVLLMTLIGAWLTLAVVLPTGARLSIDRLLPIPSGADILLLQRETVNDAWDLPKQTTMQAFFTRQPQWADYKAVSSSFEWPWYYAFQQVGDQTAEPLALAYREGRLQRERMATWIALLSPPSLLERLLQGLAGTDMQAAIAYEDSVRAFHAELRGFYYPKLFRHVPFDPSALKDIPEYCPVPAG